MPGATIGEKEGLVYSPMEPRISAVLLAAGLSRRMGGDKLLIEHGGKTMLQRAADLLSSLPVDEKILVTTRARLDALRLPYGVTVAINARPEEGQSRSVRLGLELASGEWYFFMLADQPGLEIADLRELIEYAGLYEGKIIYPAIDGNPCTPALFSSRFRTELLALSGDVGGRAVRDAHPAACIAVEPMRPELFYDIDYMGDFYGKTYCKRNRNRVP